MNIYEAFELDMDKGEVVSLVGGGGKTTTLFKLANELKNLNKKVLVTTTTAIYNPEDSQYDQYFLKELKNFSVMEGTVTIYGEEVKKGKLFGPCPEKIDSVARQGIFNFILIEADGFRGKPIKAYAHYEPVIPKFTTKTIAIIGLDSLGKSIEEIAHRPEILANITNVKKSHIIDEETVVKLVLSPKGLFKGYKGVPILMLNKGKDEELVLKGKRIGSMLYRRGFKGKVLVSDIQKDKFYHVIEN